MNPHVVALTILKEIQAVHPGFPVQYEHVAEYISQEIGRPIAFHPYPLPPAATAMCVVKSYYEKIRILLNQNRPIESQRLGAFHELSHLACKHKTGIRMYGENPMGEEDPLERKQADYVAVNVMLPEAVVWQLAAECRHPFRLIFSMKKTFGASIEASTRRIVQLKAFHGAFFLYDPRRLYFGYNTPDFQYNSEKLKRFMAQEYYRLRPDDRVEREFPDGTMEYCAKYRNGQVMLALICGQGNVYEQLSRSWSEWFGVNIPLMVTTR